MEINKLKILYDALIPDDSYFKVSVMPGIDKENPSYEDVKSLLHHCVHYKETGFDCILTAMEDYAILRCNDERRKY